MRILYFSDVHIEIRERDASPPWSSTLPLGFGPDLSPHVGAVDLLVLAGDIGRVHSSRNVSPLAYAEQAAAFIGCRVVLIPGNHEYYRGSFDEDRAALLAARSCVVTVLDRSEALFPAAPAPLRVLGATLWTDYALAGDCEGAMEVAAREIRDHSLIRRSAGSLPFLPADALAEHRLSRAWLARKLAEPPQRADHRRHAPRPTPGRLSPRTRPEQAGTCLLLGLRRSDRGGLLRRCCGVDFRPPPLEPYR